MTSLVKVVCALIYQDDLVLAVQRSASMSRPLLWEFPGGKIEANEPLLKAIIREVNEELSLTIEPVELGSGIQYQYPDVWIELIPIKAKVRNPHNITLHEHLSYAWVDKNNLQILEWSPADILLLPFAEKGI